MIAIDLAERARAAARSGTAHISGVAGALPPYRYDQDEIAAALKQLWLGRLRHPEALDRLHARTGVKTRHLAIPLQRYPGLKSWGEANCAWLECAEELGAAALDDAISAAGLSRRDIDALFVVSITGVASPSLDARLINRLGLRTDIKRTPVFGIGCVGGAVGLTRAADYVLAYPRHNAALLAVELCSLTFQDADLSTANLVSAGLFGDGAAAAIVSGGGTPNRAVPGQKRAMPAILATHSVFYPGTEDVMGWDISESGFRIVLSPRLPGLIRQQLTGDVDDFLARHGLLRSDIGTWVIHTGGPKVLDAIQDALDLPDRALDRSWDCLARFGNLSSASVLLVLEDVTANDPPEPGSLGVLLAMGPGFCSEMVLLRW